jgi:branched-chain amino acid transport system substrate-binding protein
MKKIKILLVVTMLLPIIFWSCQNKPEVIKIGAALPLTGEVSAQGKYWKQGLELALDDAIENGLIKKGEVELVIEDTQADPKKAVNVFNKLSIVDKVIACIPGTSGVTLSIKPYANKEKIVLINGSAISPEIEDADDYIYSILPDANLEGAFLAEFGFSKLQKHRAAIIYRNDPSGISFCNAISTRFKELGGEIIYIGAHEPNNFKFESHLMNIAQSKTIDIIYLMSWCPEIANFAKQAKEKNINSPILTYETFYSEKSIEIAKEAANMVLFCSPKFDVNTEESKVVELKNKVYKKYHQTEFNYYIAIHYDAMMMLLKAISEGNRDGDSVKKYFDNIGYYEGVTGRIKFSKKGSAIVPLVIYKTENGKFTLFDNIK